MNGLNESIKASQQAAQAQQAPTPGHQLKPRQPQEFSGKEGKGVLSAKDWLFLVEEYLYIITGVINDAQAVSYAGTLLTDFAASWWVSYRPKHPALTWEEFKNSLIREFQDVNESRSARDKLLQLKQGFRGVQQYASEFRNVVRKLPNMDMEDQVYFFINGLKSPEVQMQVNLRAPASLDDAIQDAHNAELRSMSSPAYGFRVNTPRQNILPVPPLPTPAVNQNPVPMEIGTVGRVHAQPQVRRLLSPEEREALFQNNGCFYCRVHNAGHLAANCPLKNRNFRRGQ
jgi:hypothetical protein